MITDQVGNVVARHDYLPYGEEIPNGVAGRSGNFASSGNVTQMFTGQERDGGTAVLDYFNARHLSAVTGGFTQADPGNAGASLTSPQSWNGYAYALGNPMVYTDPSGMSLWDIIKKFFGGSNCGADFCGGTSGYGDINVNQLGWGGGLSSGGNVTVASSGGGRVYDNGDVFRTSLNFADPAKTGTLTCSGTARVLKGNSKQIGLPGGWDGDFIKPHILVTKNGAAIIPSQWGVTDKGPFRQYLGDISGKFPNANAAFQGVSDIVGGKRDPMFPKLPVQQGLMAHYPGVLIIELPGGKDLETTAVTLSVPSAVGCPQGTSVVP